MVDESPCDERPTDPLTDEPSIETLPPEVATLLILIGIAGIPLPGPGIPFILAGGLTLWPKTFGPMDVKFRRAYPKSHRKVRQVLSRFEQDLHRRYPAG